MNNHEITLTAGQQKAYEKLNRFANRSDYFSMDFQGEKVDPDRIFILKGYAGTGKTTLIRTFVKYLDEHHMAYRLLASTGRAAKIMANVVEADACTIHSMIYAFNDFNQDLEEIDTQRNETGFDSTGQLFLNFSLKEIIRFSDTPIFYIVDESSMISDVEDKNATQAQFGSGRLLNDLLTYDKLARIVFVGDPCQLPPVTQPESPALTPSWFRNYAATPWEAELTEVMRQADGNDIVLSAQKVRNCCQNPQPTKAASFPFRNYNHIHLLQSEVDLLRRYVDDVKQYGFNHATLLTLSNKRCNELTAFLRPAFGIQSTQLAVGDLLLITQNNLLTNLMNGDLVTVEETGITEHRAGLTFMKIKVKELFTQRTYTQFIITEIVYQNQTNLTQVQQKELFIDFYYRMKDLGYKQGSDKFNQRLTEDPYLNALRAVYGYALTCHKAQGGEWDNVYLDVPRNLPYIPKPYVYQWMYTAMTRASKELYTNDDYWVR